MSRPSSPAKRARAGSWSRTSTESDRDRLQDVRRIGDDDVECLAGNGREQIALEKADALSTALRLRIVARDCESGCRDIDGSDSCASGSYGTRARSAMAPEPVPTSTMRGVRKRFAAE